MLMLSSGMKEKKEGFWVKDIRTRGKREAVGQKKVEILAPRGCAYGSPKIMFATDDRIFVLDKIILAWTKINFSSR